MYYGFISSLHIPLQFMYYGFNYALHLPHFHFPPVDLGGKPRLFPKLREFVILGSLLELSMSAQMFLTISKEQRNARHGMP